jgi:hypothetical protein
MQRRLQKFVPSYTVGKGNKEKESSVVDLYLYPNPDPDPGGQKMTRKYKFFVTKTLDPDLYPDPDSMKTNPQH